MTSWVCVACDIMGGCGMCVPSWVGVASIVDVTL